MFGTILIIFNRLKNYVKKILHAAEVLKTDSFHDYEALFLHTIQFVAVDNILYNQLDDTLCEFL